jgi:hypothetical protein
MHSNRFKGDIYEDNAEMSLQVLPAQHSVLFDARTPLMNCARARGDAAAAITCVGCKAR